MLGREHSVGHPALTDTSTGLANLLHFELVYSYLFHGTDRGVPLTVMLVSTPAVAPATKRPPMHPRKGTTLSTIR